jgi:hypothetical protein
LLIFDLLFAFDDDFGDIFLGSFFFGSFFVLLLLLFLLLVFEETGGTGGLVLIGSGAFVFMTTGALLILGGTGAFVFTDIIMPPFPLPLPSPIIIPLPSIDMPFPLETGESDIVGE